jgi:hypothetical protein
MTPDWDGDNRESYVDETKAPGLEQIVRKWYRGKDYETNLTIPKTSCKYYTDSTSLNEVKLIDYNLPQNIEIGYGNFAIVVKRIHDGYDNQSDNSGLAFRNLQMVQSVEYSFGDGKWYKLDHIAANSPFSINLEEYEQNQRYPINNKKFVVRFQDFFPKT